MSTYLLQEIWISPLVGEATAPLEGNQQRPALIVLRDDNTLNVYNVENGVEMASVYLGNSAKFKEMSCNQETASIVVKSTRHRPSNAPGPRSVRDGDLVVPELYLPPAARRLASQLIWSLTRRSCYCSASSTSAV